MISIKIFLNYIFIYLFTFFIYIYPAITIIFLNFGLNFFNTVSLFVNVFPFILTIYYFKSKNSSSVLKIIIYNGIGVGFIGFNISSISLLLTLFLKNTDKIGFISIFYIILISIVAFFNATNINLKKISLKSKKIKKKTKVVFFSDVHLGSNSKKHLLKIFKKVSSINCDLVLIGGDLYDSSQFDLNELKIFKKIGKPILYVTGNHEFYLKNAAQKLSYLKNYNLNVIDNKPYLYQNLNIIGIGDNQKLKFKERTIKKLYSKNKFNLILIHKPEIWKKLHKKIDLMLAGHTHNGQIFPFNFIVKTKFRNIYGLFQKKNSYLYTSSGSGCWGPKMRLGSVNEILEITINSE